MNRLLKTLGWLALVCVGLWVGLAVLDVGLEIVDDSFWWMRRKLLPGLIWSILIGGGLWVGWGLVSRNGRVG